MSAIAGVASFIAFPLVGALSDRTVSRYGRRRPWIAIGAVVFAGGLAVLGTQHTFAGIAIGWSIALAGFSALAAALTAMISDQVPVGQRGVISAWISVPQAVGTIVGLLLIEGLAWSMAQSYLLAAGLLIVLVLPFLIGAPDAPTANRNDGPLGLRHIASNLWIDPRTHPDFAWTLTGRVFVNLGNALGTTLLLYFLTYGLHDSQAEGDLVVLVLIYLVALVTATLIAGRASDRLGRRRIFVGVAAVLQAAAALVLALVPDLRAAMVGAALLGAGYGVFLSVDQALATQVLPDAESRGKDLGIMNIATAVPQAFGPILGAGIVLATGGFPILFAASAVLCALGAASVSRVRSVR